MTKNELMSILDLPRHDFSNATTELTANELTVNEIPTVSANEMAASELATSELAVNELAANEIASNEISHSDVTRNDTVPDFGQNHPELHSDVMHTDSYEPCISTQIKFHTLINPACKLSPPTSTAALGSQL